MNAGNQKSKHQVLKFHNLFVQSIKSILYFSCLAFRECNGIYFLCRSQTDRQDSGEL